MSWSRVLHLRLYTGLIMTRTFRTVIDIHKYCLQPVTAAAMHEALSDAAGTAPVAILSSHDNENPVSSTWIARFLES